ncbi:Hypothetical protein SMAX5B_001173 [Scophthalmus maximus]|uniref:Uncharacterized protein n=1 Tax=Scophthalmus maximus TaxID=52904 RepID=A0A2U9CA56_SCOMX|nr:Hypothetical protein SMAX5B_001173 [Scophthalmus maximus]
MTETETERGAGSLWTPRRRMRNPIPKLGPAEEEEPDSDVQTKDVQSEPDRQRQISRKGDLIRFQSAQIYFFLSFGTKPLGGGERDTGLFVTSSSSSSSAFSPAEVKHVKHTVLCVRLDVLYCKTQLCCPCRRGAGTEDPSGVCGHSQPATTSACGHVGDPLTDGGVALSYR